MVTILNTKLDNKFIFILILLILSYSCSTEESNYSEVIRIDLNQKNSSNLPISIKSIIPLETNASSLFGNIDAIEYFANRIYLLDIFKSRSILVFNENGDFINKTKLGKGPGEMINPFAFFVDRNNNNVLVWDQTLSTLFTYDLDLNFLNKGAYDVNIQNFAKVDNDKMLVHSHFNKDFSYTLYSSDFKSLEEHFIPDFNYKMVQGLYRPISTGNRTLLITPFDYNIYQYKNSQVSSKYYLDFGKYEISKKEILENGVKNINNLVELGKRVTGPYELSASDNFLLFHVFFKKMPHFFIHSLKAGKTYCMNDCFENSILPKCRICGIIENDIFYAIIDPMDLMKFKVKTDSVVTDQSQINKNPFIITFSISESL